MNFQWPKWDQYIQELRILSRSLFDCESLNLNVKIQVSQFVSNSHNLIISDWGSRDQREWVFKVREGSQLVVSKSLSQTLTSQCLEVSRESFKSISCCDNDLGFFCLLHQPYEFSMKDCRCNAFLNRKKGLLRIAVTIILNDVVLMILRGGQKSIHVAI